MDESHWIERAQTAEASLETLRQGQGAAITKIKEFKQNFGVREKSDGSIDIDFEHFTKAIGVESALILRAIIDETYQISGAPGDKPRIRATA